MPDAPAVPPERGHGGVQAGRHAEPAPEPRREATPDDTVSQPPRPAADDPEATAARPGSEPDEAGQDQPRRRERILFGESDDLLADVDTGVNENEFKW
jgi:hypothetical protein